MTASVDHGTPARRIGLARRFAIPALAVLPILAVVAMVARYGVNVPFQDEWDWSVAHVVRGDLLELRFGEFWRLGNEHRLFVPSVLMAAVGHLTNLDMIVPLYVKIAITGIVLVVLVVIFRRTSGFEGSRIGSRWVAVPFSLLLFSLAQWPRWMDVRPVPSTLAILGMTVAVLAASGAPTPRRFACAVAFATVSSLSYFAGNVTWLVVGVVMLVGGWGRRYLGAWIAFALVVAIPYTSDFMAGGSLARVEEPASPGSMAQFLLTFLGSPMSSMNLRDPEQLQAQVFGAFGLAAAIAMAVWICRRPAGARQALPWIAIALWVIINAGAAAYGRAGPMGLTGARGPKYTVFGTLFWVSVLALSFLLQRRGTPAGVRIASVGVALVLAVGLVNGTARALPQNGREPFAGRLRSGRDLLLIADAVPDSQLAVLHPRPTTIRELLPHLIARRASFLFGRRVLDPEDAQMDGSVITGPLRWKRDGRGVTTLDVQVPLQISWRVEVLDRPSTQLHLGWKAAPGEDPITLIVQARDAGGQRELMRQPLAGDRRSDEAELVQVDLRSFRSREIDLIVALEGPSGSRVTLVDPAIVYTMEDR